MRTDTQMRALILQYPELHLSHRPGCKHGWRVENPHSGDFLPISGSPSDFRSLNNFRAALRRLALTGAGLIASRTGRQPVY